MIRQLRKKFIWVAMGSMFVVLAVIVGVLNVASYIGMVRNADGILTMLAENEGRFPMDMHLGAPGDFPKPDRQRQAEGFRGMSAETPYETRFFSVRMTEGGEVISVDTGRIAAVETADAVDYAEKIYAAQKEKGFYGNYRFLNQLAGGTGSRVIFVDCSRGMRDFRSLIRNSVGVALLGMLAVFLLVLFFSGKVFAPVEESYQKQRRFVTDASHELKTPLAIISANVDILEMEGQQNNWTASIRNQVERLTTLTGQMVTLARMDEQQRGETKEFSLSQVVRETAESFRPMALDMEKRLETEIEENVFYKGDEAKLRQLVSLLLDNALKYSDDRGVIRLAMESCRKKGSRVRLTLWNTVDAEAGLEPGGQDKLFERFYRPDASRSSKTGGSGIGLSIAKSIVELHKGRITAESPDGKSILFTVFL